MHALLYQHMKLNNVNISSLLESHPEFLGMIQGKPGYHDIGTSWPPSPYPSKKSSRMRMLYRHWGIPFPSNRVLKKMIWVKSLYQASSCFSHCLLFTSKKCCLNREVPMNSHFQILICDKIFQEKGHVLTSKSGTKDGSFKYSWNVHCAIEIVPSRSSALLIGGANLIS